MSQFLSKIQRILNSLTDQYLKVKERLDTVEKRVTDNESFTDKQLDEKDQKIAGLERTIITLEGKLALLEGRIKDLEKPIFKPHPKPSLPPWNPNDPYGPGSPWKPAPHVPNWPQFPPVSPIDPAPTIPLKPYYESPVWCSKCGLNQQNASGYCCMRVDCPSKGVSICTVTVDNNGGNTTT